LRTQANLEIRIIKASEGLFFRGESCERLKRTYDKGGHSNLLSKTLFDVSQSLGKVVRLFFRPLKKNQGALPLPPLPKTQLRARKWQETVFILVDTCPPYGALENSETGKSAPGQEKHPLVYIRLISGR